MTERLTDEIDYPDDPPGIDPTTSDMPLVADAAERVIEFIKWFGDGRVFVDPEERTAPPLYARDMEALTRLVTRPESGAIPTRVEWGHRYPSGSVIADSSETVARSRAVISAAKGDPLVLMRRSVTDWEEVDA